MGDNASSLDHSGWLRRSDCIFHGSWLRFRHSLLYLYLDREFVGGLLQTTDGVVDIASNVKVVVPKQVVKLIKLTAINF